MTLDMSKANMSQLYEIAFHDNEIPASIKWDALHEIEKRKPQQRFEREQYTTQAIYHR